ncbi:MAG: vitamin B12-dependent ribonucleotide reductase [Phycisphaerae bacterium]
MFKRKSEDTTMAKTAPKQIEVQRFFSKEGVCPFDEIKWETREAVIADEKGNVIFRQDGIETPSTWSQLATKIVVSKYFYGEAGTEERENSVRQLVHRVARAVADRGYKDGYFASEEQREIFYNELVYLCVNQYGAFNSPVWFNVGLKDVYGVTGSAHNWHWDNEKGESIFGEDTYSFPQASACFIQSVEDSMEDIMRLSASEAMLFKHGSGTGTDLSTLRSSREKLSGGGTPSGPLSFMRVFDQIAGVIKSGGKTRRAAKMQSLKVYHPDIKEFINCKLEEEKKAWALIEQGYSGDFNGDAYASVMFQNANLSVRVTDDFMTAVENDGTWTTRAITTGEEMETLQARELMDMICEGTRVCGDPGLQYDSTINKWHTCPNEAPINASNPCSEYMFIDNSACNLASLNLMKFRNADGSFNVEAFRKAVKIFIIAQDIFVDQGSYPEKRISDNSHKFRPLGLGYANLGCLMMSLALPYDSDAARELASAITAIMTGTAYEVSAELAAQKGAFDGYKANRKPMQNVISMHREKAYSINEKICPGYMVEAAKNAWDRAYDLGSEYGFRNAQTTVLAPTGTIGFMMDCDTTGIEPDIALVKYKMLAGGGMIKIVNQTVPMALRELGYTEEQIESICESINKDDTIETSTELRPEHLPVFDCAFKAVKGKRTIPWMAHLKMMGAAQPFLSGAISKTINMPHESTREEIMQAYMEGWRMGLKAIAIYRDGSKRTQPLNTGLTNDADKKEAKKVTEVLVKKPFRRRLPETRCSITHKFSVAGHEGYLTVGLYDDGQPGELFITMAKEGSTVGGLMDVIGTCTSMSLQYGVPLVTLVDKFRHARFEPAGMTSNKDIPFAKSLIDYIFCWLGCQFLPGYAEKNTPNHSKSSTIDLTKPLKNAPKAGVKPAERASSPTEQQKPAKDKKASENSAVTVTETLTQGAEIVSMIEQFNVQFEHFQDDAPACDICGSITVRNGTCYRCHNCGNSMGCS